jgi:hypothetical protein
LPALRKLVVRSAGVAYIFDGARARSGLPGPSGNKRFPPAAQPAMRACAIARRKCRNAV